MDKGELTSRLIYNLVREGVDPGLVIQVASEIVVFGSTAAGVASAGSDLDVLIVTDATLPRVKTDALDFIPKTHAEVTSEPWLRSELCGHVTGFGFWLVGTRSWSVQPGINHEVIDRKRDRLVRLARAASRHWSNLRPRFRSRHLATIQNELRRLAVLTSGRFVPPTPLLDIVPAADVEAAAASIMELLEQRLPSAENQRQAQAVLRLAASRDGLRLRS